METSFSTRQNNDEFIGPLFPILWELCGTRHKNSTESNKSSSEMVSIRCERFAIATTLLLATVVQGSNDCSAENGQCGNPEMVDCGVYMAPSTVGDHSNLGIYTALISSPERWVIFLHLHPQTPCRLADFAHIQLATHMLDLPLEAGQGRVGQGAAQGWA